MPKRAIRPTPSTLLLAEYLADREGLTGAARDRFLRFLGESLGFQQPARPGHWRTLLALTLLCGLAGLAFDYPNPPVEASWRLAFWPGCVLLGVLLAWRLRQVEGKQAEPDREIHWRVYCLLLRPVVLAEKPGLLDRNLTDDCGPQEHLEVNPAGSLWGMLREGGADLWWSGLIGLWTGMTGVLLANLCGYAAGWLLLLPAGGLLLGPAGWVLGQCGAYWFARREVRRRWPG